MSTQITILEVVRVRDLSLVACDVTNGDIRNGMVFDVVTRPEPWRITGMAPASSPELYQQGRWGVTLASLRAGQTLTVGDVLRRAPAAD